MKKIALLPIDNRPICYSLPLDISLQNNDLELVFPDRNFLGGLNTSSNINELFNWLENLKNIDYLILSLDTIAYGGLINSRRTPDDEKTILNRVLRLEQIIKKLGAKTYAFSSIMRISNNNINEEEKEYWSRYGKRIFEYSYALHKSRRLQTANCVINTIPSDILDDYLKTRQRNFNINKYYLKLTSSGIFETLIFSKDDCAEFGLNVEEAEKLKELSIDNKNVFVKTGADEIPLSLLSRAITDGNNIKICPEFVWENSKSGISKYEDIPLEKNVLDQLHMAGAEIVDNKDDADLIFLINNFNYAQGDHVLGEPNVLDKKIDFNFKKPYFIADVNNANGADIGFINQLFEYGNKNFMGYAGYNTSANSIGCAICMAISYYLSKNKNENAYKKLNCIRFLDDWVYQGIIRKSVRKIGERQGYFDIVPHINEFKNYEEQIKKYLNYNFKEVKYSLPWNRSFEIEIEIYD